MPVKTAFLDMKIACEPFDAYSRLTFRREYLQGSSELFVFTDAFAGNVRHTDSMPDKPFRLRCAQAIYSSLYGPV